MMVVEKYGIGSAVSCEGSVVVIDVIRSFTLAAVAFSRGLKEVFLVSTPEEAFDLRRRLGAVILAGEVDGRKIPGFDFGNSPESISRRDFTGKRMILRSGSGTQGVVSAVRASEIFLGSLVVAAATVRHLRLRGSELVTLLAMGSVAGPDGEEDLACRDYMASLFTDSPIAVDRVVRAVKFSPSGLECLDPAIDYKSVGDLEWAASADIFNFAMPVSREDGLLVARRVVVE